MNRLVIKMKQFLFIYNKYSKELKSWVGNVKNFHIND